MQAFNFIKKQLNFSKKWVVTVTSKKELVTSEALTAKLMYKYGFSRKLIQEITEKVKHEIMDELLKGNTIDLFGLAKIRADFSLRKKHVGTENEIALMAEQLTERDVKSQLKANINQAFNHEYVKTFTALKRKN